MKPEFRTANPDDALHAVPLIYSSGPAAFDYVFADDAHQSAREFLLYAFRQRHGEFGYANHTVAVHEQRVVAAGACYSSRRAFAFTIVAIWQILAFYGLAAGHRVLRRGMQMERQLKLPHRQKSYIAHLGVAAERQGQGIGGRLVEHFLQEARHQNQTHAALDVSMENPRAQALYERIGFQVVDERESVLQGVPGHRRMELQL